MSDLSVSFEFFPPKTEKAESGLWKALDKLKALGPKFVSVTYGAGGSTREKTHEIVTKIQNEVGVDAAAHLTCVEYTQEEIAEIVEGYWNNNVRRIVALRGDPPGDIAGEYVPTPGGYKYADDLTAGLKALHDFEISVAGYPEMHPQAGSMEADLEHLKRKVEAGADRIITQFFFDNDAFLRYRDKVADMGLNTPVVPGILPITNFGKAVEFGGKCGTTIPDSLFERFDGFDDDPAANLDLTIAFGTEQCEELIKNGVRDFHFYTLNRAKPTKGICQALGMEAKN